MACTPVIARLGLRALVSWFGALSGVVGVVGVSAHARGQCSPQSVSLQHATATWSQPCGGFYSARYAIDGDPTTRWALGRCSGDVDETLNETMVFETQFDVPGNGTLLQFTILSGRYDGCCGGGNLTIGDFKLWATADPRGEFADGLDTGGDVDADWYLITPEFATGIRCDGSGVNLSNPDADPTLVVREDGSIYACGHDPEYAEYSIVGRCELPVIRGIRIDFLSPVSPNMGEETEGAGCLPPTNGPGRHANGNCEVRGFEMRALIPPIVDTAPADQTVCPGGAASFYCGVTGARPILYQWRRNGREIRNAVGPVYVVPRVTPATIGSYECVVTSPCGVIVSPSARLIMCEADFNCDQTIDYYDYADFVECFDSGNCFANDTADFDGDGSVDFFDYSMFVESFESGC